MWLHPFIPSAASSVFMHLRRAIFYWFGMKLCCNFFLLRPHVKSKFVMVSFCGNIIPQRLVGKSFTQ